MAKTLLKNYLKIKIMNKYLLSFSGIGVESVYIRLNKDSFSFWFQKQQEEDFDIVDYLFAPEDFEDIPEEFNFLIQDGETIEWFNHEDVFCHFYSPDLDSCYITVEEVEDNQSYKEILCEKFLKFVDEHEDVIEYQDSEVEDEYAPEQIMECNSYEKGVIFGDIFEAESFDPKLLKIIVKEAPNGIDYFDGASYNGEELSNTQSCTRGKGMVVEIWEK